MLNQYNDLRTNDIYKIYNFIIFALLTELDQLNWA